MAALHRIDGWLGATLNALCIGLVSVIFVLIIENIMRRGIGLSGRPGFDEIIELCFAWLVMLGAAAVWRDGGHFRVDLLGRGRLSWSLRMVAGLIALAVVVTLASRGYALAMRTTATSPVLGAPRVLWYACLPVSGAIMSVYALRDLVAVARGDGS